MMNIYWLIQHCHIAQGSAYSLTYGIIECLICSTNMIKVNIIPMLIYPHCATFLYFSWGHTGNFTYDLQNEKK